MSAQATEVAAPTAVTRTSEQGARTHKSVQVLPLCLCALSSVAVAAATHLPWFGSIPGDPTVPEYSAVSPLLVPPDAPAGLVPGTQSWGYLVVAWSVLLGVTAVVAVVACVVCARRPRAVGRMLVAVGVGSLVLVGLVAAELFASVRFDLDSFAHSDWGALVGLGLAVLASGGAWFAWATFVFPHRWGLARTTA